MNQCTFLGRLTRDPEIRYAKDSQMPIARFDIAVDRRRGGDSEPSADFFPCVVFDRRAEFVEQYLRSGMRILISGSMQNNNYTNKNGEKVYGTELIGNLIEFADGKRDQQDMQGQATSGSASSSAGNRGSAGTRARTSGQAVARTGALSQGSQSPKGITNTGQTVGRASAAGNQAAGNRTSGSRTGTAGRAASRGTAGRVSAARPATRAAAANDGGFMNIPDGVEDEGLPFN